MCEIGRIVINCGERLWDCCGELGCVVLCCVEMRGSVCSLVCVVACCVFCSV